MAKASVSDPGLVSIMTEGITTRCAELYATPDDDNAMPFSLWSFGITEHGPALAAEAMKVYHALCDVLINRLVAQTVEMGREDEFYELMNPIFPAIGVDEDVWEKITPQLVEFGIEFDAELIELNDMQNAFYQKYFCKLVQQIIRIRNTSLATMTFAATVVEHQILVNPDDPTLLARFMTGERLGPADHDYILAALLAFTESEPEKYHVANRLTEGLFDMLGSLIASAEEQEVELYSTARLTPKLARTLAKVVMTGEHAGVHYGTLTIDQDHPLFETVAGVVAGGEIDVEQLKELSKAILEQNPPPQGADIEVAGAEIHLMTQDGEIRKVLDSRREDEGNDDGDHR